MSCLHLQCSLINDFLSWTKCYATALLGLWFKFKAQLNFHIIVNWMKIQLSPSKQQKINLSDWLIAGIFFWGFENRLIDFYATWWVWTIESNRVNPLELLQHDETVKFKGKLSWNPICILNWGIWELNSLFVFCTKFSIAEGNKSNAIIYSSIIIRFTKSVIHIHQIYHYIAIQFCK